MSRRAPWKRAVGRMFGATLADQPIAPADPHIHLAHIGPLAEDRYGIAAVNLGRFDTA